MLFVFPGLTYMTTFPPLFQPWPTAGKYHSTLFPTKPLSVSLPAGACVMSIAGSDPMYQPSTRVHIPSVGWKHWGYGWPRDSNPGPLRWKLSTLPLWAIRTTQTLMVLSLFEEWMTDFTIKGVCATRHFCWYMNDASGEVNCKYI